MLTTAETEARVAKGAAHLDRVRPGWERRIDVGRLQLNSLCNCIIGQLGTTGDYTDNRVELQIMDAVLCGCDLNPDDSRPYLMERDRRHNVAVNFDLLQDAWIQEIARRLHPTVDEGDSAELLAVQGPGSPPQKAQS